MLYPRLIKYTLPLTNDSNLKQTNKSLSRYISCVTLKGRDKYFTKIYVYRQRYGILDMILFMYYLFIFFFLQKKIRFIQFFLNKNTK